MTSILRSIRIGLLKTTMHVGLALGIGLTCFPCHTLHAWESDVHLGLTQWLALQAGFPYEQAREIASGTQSVDDEWDTAPVWLGIKVIFANSKDSSKVLRDNHFPTVGEIPDDPKNREVEANSLMAQQAVLRELEIPYRTKPFRALRDLGRALHSFQDSWSHQGQPDVPLRPVWAISPEYAWSHPEQRGGWYSHDADLTANHIDDAFDVAEKTFVKLCDYHLKNFPQKHTRQCNETSLTRDVGEFFKASSKQAKLEWLTSHDIGREDAVAAVNFTSLSDANIDVEHRSRRVTSQSKVDTAGVAVEKFIDAFLRKWIVEGDVTTAATFVSERGLDEQFALMGFPDRKFDASRQSRQWREGFLSLWLLDDHSKADQMHHGMDPKFGYELTRNSDEKRIEVASLHEAIEWKGGKRYEILQVNAANNPFLNPASAVVFRFIHAPKDAIVLVVQKAGKQWEIIRLIAISAG